jgi:V8-like Glu-specific endopeptidase
MLEATPMPMPLPSSEEGETELGEAVLLGEDEASTSQDAFAPEEGPYAPDSYAPGEEPYAPEEEQTYLDSLTEETGELDADGAPLAEAPTMVASKGYPFTSRRASPDSTVNSWPFRLAGKLFFRKQDGKGYVCSASIINRRIMVTAGHCLYDRENNRWYNSFAFVPAYRGNYSQVNPYCTWYASSGIVPYQWAASSGFPTSDDFGLLELRDLSCYGATRRIGAWLGWLGWQTYRLIGNNITQLGYPNNLDSGQRMEVSQSNVYRRTSYAGEIGTAQGGGASGGPWVENFGVSPSGRVPIGASGYTGTNRVLGVTSYGNVNHDPNQYGGASVLNNNFVRIWNTICGRQSGNCN